MSLYIIWTIIDIIDVIVIAINKYSFAFRNEERKRSTFFFPLNCSRENLSTISLPLITASASNCGAFLPIYDIFVTCFDSNCKSNNFSVYRYDYLKYDCSKVFYYVLIICFVFMTGFFGKTANFV